MNGSDAVHHRSPMITILACLTIAGVAHGEELLGRSRPATVIKSQQANRSWRDPPLLDRTRDEKGKASISRGTGGLLTKQLAELYSFYDYIATFSDRSAWLLPSPQIWA